MRLRLRTVAVTPQPPPISPIAGATAYRVCAGAGIPYPQSALAVGAGSVWVACGGGHELLRVRPDDGRIVARIPVPTDVRVVAASAAGVWAIGTGGAVAYRVDPASNRVAARVPLEGSVSYLWTAAGSVWAVDDDSRRLLRIDEATNAIVARIPLGDGTSGFATDGRRAWLVSHRDNSLDRLELASNAVTRLVSSLAPAATAAAERIALHDGSLWITGRGLDLFHVSADDGAVLGTTEIGPAGIDVVATERAVWVASYETAAARRGDPVVGELLRVDPATAAVTLRLLPSRKLFLTGFVAEPARLWLLDSVSGLLLRIPAD